jgi:glutathione peroxidase
MFKGKQQRDLMNIYDFTVLDNKGNETPLANYKGKVLLVVNTATGCGLTPQYEALQKLYDTYKEQGLEILDFPCNQFLEQAKGSDDEIHQFCTLTYHTTFPRFKKIDVNGDTAAPIFKFLKEAMPKPTDAGNKIKNVAIAAAAKLSKAVHEDNDIKWNFTKFLVNREGNVVGRFEPTVLPEAIEASIKELL